MRGDLALEGVMDFRKTDCGMNDTISCKEIPRIIMDRTIPLSAAYVLRPAF
jgi:hypothetical protein